MKSAHSKQNKKEHQIKKKIKEKNKRKYKKNHDKKSKKRKLQKEQTREPAYLDIGDMTEKRQYVMPRLLKMKWRDSQTLSNARGQHDGFSK